ncbi:hypothetical protein MP228_011410 [Amoeboaphelidium protococcarum]|nr:hypothetical protein MP228_011410 [Amoeboaphelidium protococcarum]
MRRWTDQRFQLVSDAPWQFHVTLNSAEAEFVAVSQAIQRSIYLQHVLREVGLCDGPIQIMEDNQSAIAIASNHSSNVESRHIDIKYLYCEKKVLNGKPNQITLKFPYPVMFEMVSISMYPLDVSYNAWPAILRKALDCLLIVFESTSPPQAKLCILIIGHHWIVTEVAVMYQNVGVYNCIPSSSR